MTRESSIDEMAEKGELSRDRSQENCCAGKVDQSPFEIWGSYKLKEDAIDDLGKWLYKHSAMFDFDGAGYSDAIKMAEQIIEEASND